RILRWFGSRRATRGWPTRRARGATEINPWGLRLSPLSNSDNELHLSERDKPPLSRGDSVRWGWLRGVAAAAGGSDGPSRIRSGLGAPDGPADGSNRRRPD